MRRFFIPTSQIHNDTAVIRDKDARQIINVLRMKIGDELEATDGKSNILKTQIVEIAKSKVVVKILSIQTIEERSTQIRLFQAIPKGTKMSRIVEKMTELGVSEIIPFLSERSVLSYNKLRSANKQDRWQRLSNETMKKVGRTTQIIIREPIGLKHIAQYLKDDYLRIVPWEMENKTTLKSILQANDSHPNDSHPNPHSTKIEIVIGGEGGLSIDEIKKLKQLGFISVSLGKRILKVETAAIATVANIYYELG